MRRCACLVLLALGAVLRRQVHRVPPLVLSLPQCVDAAFAAGTDIEILQKNLAVSREQYDIAVSQSSYTLSAALGENAAYGYGDATLLASNSLASGFAQYPQAGDHPGHADHDRGIHHDSLHARKLPGTRDRGPEPGPDAGRVGDIRS